MLADDSDSAAGLAKDKQRWTKRIIAIQERIELRPSGCRGGGGVFIAWLVLSGRHRRLVLTGAVRWRATKKKDLQSDL
ncbi:hypothetical protein ACG97_12965 [Vogesella sp. EB]|uniref:hypothetical protein n=1 Tax=Vogesella sp. EB TaxID=1526735 RepID=UPI00064D6FC7|nr:hypothetical protein [Vogesella sp. EB]KMJ52564.1 hypothetical protein ACG97_12965 [Vogesella sp. EB]